jgi:galactokinase
MSAYNDRRSEGERAFEQVKRVARKVTHYRDLTPRKLATLKSKLPAPLFQRALHVVEENERVPQAAEALKRGQAKRLGQLLYASHESLSRLYQVSLPEIDALVEASRKVPGVLGLRIMGGGFGGLLLGLLESNKATEAAESLRRIYRRQTRIKGGYFFVGLDGGLKDETLSAAAPLLEPAD